MKINRSLDVTKWNPGYLLGIANASFYFDAVSAPRAGSFLLFAQKETNQRKGPPATCSVIQKQND